VGVSRPVRKKVEAPSAPSAPAAPGKTKVLVVKVLDHGTIPMATAFEKTETAAKFAQGDRVLLHGYAGGEPTGRARLLRLEGIWINSWYWSRGAEDPARILEPLSLEPAPGFSPTLNLMVDKS
jgi:hypothetical protein